MKKGQVAEGFVERLDFPNKARIRLGEELVSAKSGLPGQKVRFRIKKAQKGRMQAHVLEVLEPSPQEVEPVCPHFGVCGGCLLLSLPYGEQLRIKEAQLGRLLAPVVGEEVWSGLWEGLFPSPVELDYRNKMEYSFGDAWKGGPLALGLHKKGSFHDIVDGDACRLAHRDFSLVVAAARDFFGSRGLPYYHKTSHLGYLRHLLVRRSQATGEILLALVTSGQMEPAEEAGLLESFAGCMLGLESAMEGRFAGILHIRNDGLADVVKSQESRLLYGREGFWEEVSGLRFWISPFSFFQTNTPGAEVLYAKVREYLGDRYFSQIFDLYSGTGTIAQIVSSMADTVLGIEIVEEAVEAARQNARANGLENCHFIAGDVLAHLDALGQAPECVLLDPPRDGLHPKALSAIAGRIRPETVVYISCKASSLARDLPVFMEAGYALERMCGVDMFPQTGNVEVVVLLRKKKAYPKNIVESRMDIGDDK